MDNLSFSMGEGGEIPSSPEELEEQLRILDEKVRRDAREIVEVLRLDFPKFLERVVKDRFLAGALGDSLTEEQLRALKADVAATGERLRAEVIPGLEEWGTWVEEPAKLPPAAERKDLRGNPAVNARIQRVGTYLRELFERHKLPALKEEEVYRLPSWFVAGRYPVTHVESYWRNLEAHHAIRDALRAVREREVRSKRQERWDAL